ncbi:MAG: hypothetical protein OHK0019_30730 [Saprospiraceae bacterium]
MTFELFDVVLLNQDLPEAKLRKGNVGTIVEVLDDKTFIVEFVDNKGNTYAETVLTAAQLLKVYYEPALTQNS